MYSNEILNKFFMPHRKYKQFIPCIPPRNTHQAGNRIFKKKDGTLFIGKSQKNKKTQNELISLLQSVRPPKPYTGNISIRCLWIYPWRANEPIKNKKAGILACNKRPDCDNIAKGLLDAMQKAKWFVDDGEIFDLQVVKLYGEHFGISLEMNECTIKQ
jgi:Holliday junction resolvase RusA-like endonuclease